MQKRVREKSKNKSGRNPNAGAIHVWGPYPGIDTIGRNPKKFQGEIPKKSVRNPNAGAIHVWGAYPGIGGAARLSYHPNELIRPRG